jgi:hypothetical protein
LPPYRALATELNFCNKTAQGCGSLSQGEQRLSQPVFQYAGIKTDGLSLCFLARAISLPNGAFYGAAD